MIYTMEYYELMFSYKMEENTRLDEKELWKSIWVYLGILLLSMQWKQHKIFLNILENMLKYPKTVYSQIVAPCPTWVP